MATYKVIQDIEAEDHILGPLTLRQFIYGLVSVLFGYLNFISIVKHVGFLLIIFLPPMVLAGFFAFPFKTDQPTEVWALARIRFLIKPRRRLWSQSGIKELVTVTAPKKQTQQFSRNLSRNEVNDRLRSLALVIDSRGWSAKNTSPYLANQLVNNNQQSDRLVDLGSMPSPVPDYNTTPDEDIFDEINNPVAAQMNIKIEQSTRQHRLNLIQSLNQVRSHQQDQVSSALQSPLQLSENEKELSAALKSRTTLNGLALSNMHNLEGKRTVQPTTNNSSNNITPPGKLTEAPVSAQPTQTQAAQPATPSKPTTNPAIINLAYNNYLSIASLARQASQSSSDGEVVINLH